MSHSVKAPGVGTGIDVLKATADAAWLRYVSDRMPGITRVLTSLDFNYRYPGGKIVRDEETLTRIRKLAIPPAYEDVWICPIATGHVQAIGRDARGRRQYRYHPHWRADAGRAGLKPEEHAVPGFLRRGLSRGRRIDVTRPAPARSRRGSKSAGRGELPAG